MWETAQGGGSLTEMLPHAPRLGETAQGVGSGGLEEEQKLVILENRESMDQGCGKQRLAYGGCLINICGMLRWRGR